jgi:hypothetical protein
MKQLIFFFILFSSCQSKNEMTLEELKKADWTKLDKGVEYISTANGNVTDSIRYQIKELTMMGLIIMPEENKNPTILPIAQLTKLLNEKLPQSGKGYLRLYLDAFFQPDTMTITVYLRGTLDSNLLVSYMDTIRNQPGVQNVSFISKEMAKAKFLDDGNGDWDKILDTNPLPETIEVTFNTTNVNDELLKTFKQKILSEMSLIDDVAIPSTYEKLGSLKGSLMYLGYERF